MNLFEINYLDKMSALLKEAFKFKKYKAMPAGLAVFVGILMLPLVIVSFIVTAILSLLGFAFAVCTSPVKFLHVVVNNEGKEVKHATQFIIYFISWPLVFFCYAMMSVLLLFIVPTYAILSILLYIWSFGGFRFHILMTDTEDISITVENRYAAIPAVYVAIGSMIHYIIPFCHWLFTYISYAWDSWEVANLYSIFFLTAVYPVYIGIHCLFSTVYSLICSPYPKSKKTSETENLPSVSDSDIA